MEFRGTHVQVRNVQQVFDHFVEPQRLSVESLHVFGPLFGLAFVQQAEVYLDVSDGRAQFVADARHELIFYPIQRFQAFVGLAQFAGALGHSLFQFVRVMLHLVVQPRIINGDGSLIGKCLQTLGVSIGVKIGRL